jgi:single-stranded DNA-binding protein
MVQKVKKEYSNMAERKKTPFGSATLSGFGRLYDNPSTTQFGDTTVVTVPVVYSSYVGKTKDPNPTFLTLRVFNKTSQTYASNLQKGDTVYFSGNFMIKSWETNDGQKRQTVTTTELAAVSRKSAPVAAGVAAGESTDSAGDDDIPF